MTLVPMVSAKGPPSCATTQTHAPMMPAALIRDVSTPTTISPAMTATLALRTICVLREAVVEPPLRVQTAMSAHPIPVMRRLAAISNPILFPVMMGISALPAIFALGAVAHLGRTHVLAPRIQTVFPKRMETSAMVH